MIIGFVGGARGAGIDDIERDAAEENTRGGQDREGGEEKFQAGVEEERPAGEEAAGPAEEGGTEEETGELGPVRVEMPQAEPAIAPGNQRRHNEAESTEAMEPAGDLGQTGRLG